MNTWCSTTQLWFLPAHTTHSRTSGALTVFFTWLLSILFSSKIKWIYRKREKERKTNDSRHGKQLYFRFPHFSPGAHSSTENTSPLALVKVTPGLPPLCWHNTGVSLRNSLGHSCTPTGVWGSCWGFSSPLLSAWTLTQQRVKTQQN